MAGLGFEGLGALLSGGNIGQALINSIDPTGGKDIFGSRPDVAPYTPLDLSAETGKSVTGNLANLPAISGLLDKIIPGFSDLLKTGTGNALSELQGKLPTDVASQIQRSSAYQALQGGYGGTGMAHALTARDLGRTSLDLTNMGANNAQIWSKLAEEAYSPWMTSTGQQASVTSANNYGQQATQQFKFNVAASPDPALAGQFALDQHIGDQFMSFGLGAAGGALAGGGGSSVARPGATAPAYPGYQPYNWQTTPTWGG